MKRFVFLSFVTGLLFTLVSCSSKPCDKQQNIYYRLLGGKHELKAVKYRYNDSTETTEYFYSNKNTGNIEMMVKCTGGEFRNIVLSANKVMFREVDTTVEVDYTTPYVKFYWINRYRDESSTNLIYQNDITGAVISSKNVDFSIDIRTIKK